MFIFKVYSSTMKSFKFYCPTMLSKFPQWSEGVTNKSKYFSRLVKKVNRVSLSFRANPSSEQKVLQKSLTQSSIGSCFAIKCRSIIIEMQWTWIWIVFHSFEQNFLYRKVNFAKRNIDWHNTPTTIVSKCS